jgi:L-amino acid N-acyltransferase YncA
VATYWVLENADGDVVGSASIVREWSDWHAADYWWVQSMFVHPDRRGQGLSGLLLDEVVRQARGRRARSESGCTCTRTMSARSPPIAATVSTTRPIR